MITSNKNSYSASFTSGGLLFPEFDALIPILISENKYELLNREILENKYLKINSESSRKRIVSELKKRAKYTDLVFYDFYSVSTAQQKKLLLFYLMLKVYPLVFTFHFDVTVDNWKKGVNNIDPYNYQMKLDELSANHQNVDKWTDQTKKKVISVYNVMLTQAGLIKNKTLTPIQTQEQFWCFFFNNDAKWFLDACLLYNESKKRLQNYCL